MTDWPEGNAIVYCQGAFAESTGKSAHGLVRKTQRYRVLSVVDETLAGRDAGEVLGDGPNGVFIHASIEDAVAAAHAADRHPTHLVIGLAPDGGRLGQRGRDDVAQAIALGLHVDSGLHDYLSDDPRLVGLAEQYGVRLRDVRRPPPRQDQHFFTGEIEAVDCLRLAVLGTDSALGKRTTSWIIVDGLSERGHPTELIGTGQTAWLQGARYSLMLDAMVADFISGEVEYQACRAWAEQKPEALVFEGQGSLMNPAYPGGLEIVAGGRPHAIVLQHAPARRDYDGFPGYPIQSLRHQILGLEVLTERPVVAVTINHEGLTPDETRAACQAIEAETGRVTCDPLRDDGPKRLLDRLEPLLEPEVRGKLHVNIAAMLAHR